MWNHIVNTFEHIGTIRAIGELERLGYRRAAQNLREQLGQR